MDSNNFAGIPYLVKVELKGNICIDEDFSSNFQKLPNIIKSECGYENWMVDTGKTLKRQIFDITDQVKNISSATEQLAKIESLEEKIEELQAEVINKTEEIAKLETELIVTKVSKTEAGNQIDKIHTPKVENRPKNIKGYNGTIIDKPHMPTDPHTENSTFTDQSSESENSEMVESETVGPTHTEPPRTTIQYSESENSDMEVETIESRDEEGEILETNHEEVEVVETNHEEVKNEETNHVEVEIENHENFESFESDDQYQRQLKTKGNKRPKTLKKSHKKGSAAKGKNIIKG